MASPKLACILSLTAVALGSALKSAEQGALSKDAQEDKVARMEVCEYCTTLCPIACFAGDCPNDLETLPSIFPISRYHKSKKCFSCDPSVSVGISKNWDLFKCESLADIGGKPQLELPSGASSFYAEKPLKDPFTPGKAAQRAANAKEQAEIAMRAATQGAAFAKKAAELSEKANGAKPAPAMKSSSTSHGNGTKLSDPINPAGMEAESEEDEAGLAAEIKAHETFQASKTAHTAWKIALNKYNVELWKLRRQQLVTQMAEKKMERAKKVSDDARMGFSLAKASEHEAMQQAIMTGGDKKTEIAMAAEEMQKGNEAAKRRLLFAARAAYEARNQLSGVTAKYRMQPNKPAEAAKPAAAKPASPPPEFKISNLQHSQSTMQGVSAAGMEEAMAENLEPKTSSIADQMTQNLEARLAQNPAAIEDLSLFAPPTASLPPQPASSVLPLV